MSKKQRIIKGVLHIKDFEDKTLEDFLVAINENFGVVPLRDLVFEDNLSEWDSERRFRLLYSPEETDAEMADRLKEERRQEAARKKLIRERELQELARLKAKYEKGA